MKRQIKDGWPNESAQCHWDSHPPPREGPCASFQGFLGESVYPWAFPVDQMGFCILRERRRMRFTEHLPTVSGPLISSPPLTIRGRWAHFAAEGNEGDRCRVVTCPKPGRCTCLFDFHSRHAFVPFWPLSREDSPAFSPSFLKPRALGFCSFLFPLPQPPL